MKTPKEKKCTKCGEVKELDKYSKNSYAKDGKRSYCKACSKRYREENRDRILVSKKKYYEKNKDKWTQYRNDNKERINANNRKWKRNNIEKIKEYAENNKEKLREYYKSRYEEKKGEILDKQKSKYDKNRKQILSRCKIYRDKNKERIRERDRKYRINNKDKIIAYIEKNRDKRLRYSRDCSEKLTDGYVKGLILDFLKRRNIDFCDISPTMIEMYRKSVKSKRLKNKLLKKLKITKNN